MRAVVGLAVIIALGAVLVSGGSGADSVRHRYLPARNELRTVSLYGRARVVRTQSLGRLGAFGANPPWLAAARPLGPEAPPWARRLYTRSLLVLRGLTDRRTGAVVAGARQGWAYVWPRDASAVALALAAAGYRGEARRVVRFLLGLDLAAAARFNDDGTPVDGRAAQGDAAGWVAVAARAAGLAVAVTGQPWREHSDYQEGEAGDYLGNAIAAGAAARPAAGGAMTQEQAERAVQAQFGDRDGLFRTADEPDSGLDSAAAWAVRPFALPALYPLARRTLLRLAAEGSRFGIVPSQGWGGGEDPWTAPTAWTAWGLAALGERHAALRLMAALRRDATATSLLPERIDADTGVPASTTPLAWSHAFTVLALRELWPNGPQPGRRQRPSQ
jgi:glucoamylase